MRGREREDGRLMRVSERERSGVPRTPKYCYLNPLDRRLTHFTGSQMEKPVDDFCATKGIYVYMKVITRSTEADQVRPYGEDSLGNFIVYIYS